MSTAGDGGDGGGRVVYGVPITACLCAGGGVASAGDASICSSFPSRQAPRSSWPLEFASEVGDSSILIDCLGRKPRKFVAPRVRAATTVALLPLGPLYAPCTAPVSGNAAAAPSIEAAHAAMASRRRTLVLFRIKVSNLRSRSQFPSAIAWKKKMCQL